MNNLVERYIYDVVHRLPENERDEVRRELESNIADMLPDNPSEDDIIAVLSSLGAPSKLSVEYRQKPCYLISPAVYDSYILVLKKVMLIVALAVGCAMVLAEMLNFQEAETIGTLISRIISSAISGAVQGVCAAAFWVTVGFVIAERRGLYKEKAWTVNNLPDLPDKKGVSLSRSSIIVSMALNVFFTGLFILFINNYGSLLILSFNREVIHPFTQEALYRSIPYILLLSFLSLAVSGVKLYYGRWNVTVCIVNLLHHIIWVPVVINILHWSDLLSADFILFAERTFTADMDILSYIATGGIMFIISAALILAAVVDSVVGIGKTYKGYR